MQDLLTQLKPKTRDTYIDLLRAIGLLLIVMAHTWPPAWMAASRPFVVPMLVMISAACYRNPDNSYHAYLKKRFRRIYIPTAIFLTIFFILLSGAHLLGFVPAISYPKTIGSYLLLDTPSIGYVWIMRVMLLMAIILPPLHKLLKNTTPAIILLLTATLVTAQHFLCQEAQHLSDPMAKLIANQFLLYITGYAPFAILGLTMHRLPRATFIVIALAAGVLTIGFSYCSDNGFEPDIYKYPPRSLFLYYGLCVCSLLVLLRPVLSTLGRNKVVTFLSTRSLDIYLWHIIPVYLMLPVAHISGMWFARYCAALAGGIILSFLYTLVAKKITTSFNKK